MPSSDQIKTHKSTKSKYENVEIQEFEMQEVRDYLKEEGFDDEEIEALIEEAREDLIKRPVPGEISWLIMAGLSRYGPKASSWSYKKLNRKLVKTPSLVGTSKRTGLIIILFFIALFLIGLAFTVFVDVLSLLSQVLEYLLPTSYK